MWLKVFYLMIVVGGFVFMIVSWNVWRKRDPLRRIGRASDAPTADDVLLRTTEGRVLSVGDLHGRVTILVTVPVPGVDPAELAALLEFGRELSPDFVRVMIQPIGEGDFRGEVPEGVEVLAVARRHPLAYRVERAFGPVDAPLTKIVIDGSGHVRALLTPDIRPPDAELYRAVEAALADLMPAAVGRA